MADSLAFIQWLPNVIGKFVLISMPQPTGRPDYNWNEFGTKASIEAMKKIVLHKPKHGANALVKPD